MTSSPSETIAKAMEGVTPGPWQIEGKWSGGYYLSTMHPSPIFELGPIVGVSAKHKANAAYIAACNPVAMREVLDELKRLRAAVGKDAREFMQSLVDDASRYNALHKEAARQAEALQRENAELREALRPFADVADLVDSETEGVADSDEFQMHFHDYLMASWKLSIFRRARALLGGENAE